ncbi:unnamed protein product [Peronospora belbahrii]|uniref:Retrotransposon gag domain-containing protein n=1 Tax=Peronospora belbahrii TaxID=622444 RepID=A0AAU9L3E2_9STRA|nr:unnamed protein product [Peronospora belbahrii]
MSLLQARAESADDEQQAHETATCVQPRKSRASDRFNFQPTEMSQDPYRITPRHVTKLPGEECLPIRSCEYDPDDMDLDGPLARMANATLGQVPNMVPRIKLSATSDLKEFHGEDHDEDQARSWVTTVKTALTRDQAPDGEKCRSVCGNWKNLFQEFQMQFCGLGVQVARQYYHAKKRSDESPLGYLYRLNVIGLRAKIKIKDGPPKIQKEYAEHYIETLDDPDLADQLTVLRLADVEELEDVLRARQWTKARRGKMLFGSGKFRQKALITPDRPRELDRRSVHAV